jgi:endonuclease YncB( thermonuclease family)
VGSLGFKVLKGRFVVVGKEPDGDSVRFIPDAANPWSDLQGGDRAVRAQSKADGSIQLRLEGIDAPELHYGGDAQPDGASARDDLLRRLGFTRITYLPGSTMVESATPESVRGAILTKLVEIHGRPVAYVLTDDVASAFADGSWRIVRPPLVNQSLNAALLADGSAYYTVYTSTPLTHQRALQGLAAKARSERLGVWAADETSDFVLVDEASIGPTGELVLPKLFRRCTDYLKAVTEKGFTGNLPDWIRNPGSPTRDENDQVLINGSIRTHLADLLQQVDTTIQFTADLLQIAFVEKA